MTIQMANRLVELRRASGLSQDAVAEKIGVSRQAVSKWERAEAAPDTDNLIALANLYDVSVDELLCLDNPNPGTKKKKERTTDDHDTGRGIDVELPFIKVHIADRSDTSTSEHRRSGRRKGDKNMKNKERWFSEAADDFYEEAEEDIAVEILDDDDRPFSFVFGEEMEKVSLWFKFPYPVLVAIAYLLMGFLWKLWHPGWIIFLTIPVYYWIGNAISKRRIPEISVSFIITLAYLVMGFGWGLWHPWWIIFLAIPILDFIIKLFKK